MAVALGSTGTFLVYATAITTTAVPVPASVAANDIILAYLYFDTTSPGTITPPAGFTELVFSPTLNVALHSMESHVYWKRATGPDSGTYSFTHSSSNTEAVAMRFTGCEPVHTPVNVLGSAVRSTSDVVTPPVSGTTTVDAEMVVFGAWAFIGTAMTSLGAPWTDGANAQGFYTAAESQAVTGSTGSISTSYTGSQPSYATLVGLLPPLTGEFRIVTPTACRRARNW